MRQTPVSKPRSRDGRMPEPNSRYRKQKSVRQKEFAVATDSFSFALNGCYYRDKNGRIKKVRLYKMAEKGKE